MKINKTILEQLVREELSRTFAENFSPGQQGMTIHPFDNELANQEDNIPIENIYEQVADATLMEMMSVYDAKKIREIIRFFAAKATQGPGGVGGILTDAQIEEILLKVFEKVEEKIGIDLGSEMPEDREHPQYRDLD